MPKQFNFAPKLRAKKRELERKPTGDHHEARCSLDQFEVPYLNVPSDPERYTNNVLEDPHAQAR